MSSLRLSPLSLSYISLDIGGTTTRIARFSSLVIPIYTPLARFPTQQSYEQQVQQIASSLQNHKVSGPTTAIGASIGGRLTRDGRSVLAAPNLPDYVGQPFAQDLEQRFHCPVRLAHDTVCGLLGESTFGVLKERERCAYLTVSTGTGAAIQLRKAEHQLFVSIEIGHQLLDGNQRPCLCGQIGCLETFTGGRQLELRGEQPATKQADQAFWSVFCDKLALGLINLTQLTRVETIAVGGAIALHNALLLPLLQDRINAQLKGSTLELQYASLGEDAPLIGALALLNVADDTILH